MQVSRWLYGGDIHAIAVQWGEVVSTFSPAQIFITVSSFFLSWAWLSAAFGSVAKVDYVEYSDVH